MPVGTSGRAQWGGGGGCNKDQGQWTGSPASCTCLNFEGEAPARTKRGRSTIKGEVGLPGTSGTTHLDVLWGGVPPGCSRPMLWRCSASAARRMWKGGEGGGGG